MGQTLVELCRATGGRTLALFTSASALRATHAAIQSPLSQAGILVLGQGIDGSAKQLLETLKTNPRTVLLGTSSFWEGVDVMGSSLSLLVIARLPFAVPTDPVFEARAERYQDSFSQYTLPQAVLRFKQGFGRLIRSHRDRGVVVVVDSRLHSRPYGRAFLDSLPRCKVKQGLTRELVPQVLKWLGG
jgi:DNA polymerase-3 subunit epsilon/ATP-dependent DNA helicase DinG